MTSPFLRHPTSWHHAAAQSLCVCVCALNDFQLFFQKWLARSSSHPEQHFGRRSRRLCFQLLLFLLLVVVTRIVMPLRAWPRLTTIMVSGEKYGKNH